MIETVKSEGGGLMIEIGGHDIVHWQYLTGGGVVAGPFLESETGCPQGSGQGHAQGHHEEGPSGPGHALYRRGVDHDHGQEQGHHGQEARDVSNYAGLLLPDNMLYWWLSIRRQCLFLRAVSPVPQKETLKTSTEWCSDSAEFSGSSARRFSWPSFERGSSLGP